MILICLSIHVTWPSQPRLGMFVRITRGAMKQISILRTITEVEDGRAYNGTLSVGTVTLKFEIRFSVPLPELDKRWEQPTMNELRQVAAITLKKKDGATIEIDEDEHIFFWLLITELASEFYWAPKTRLYHGRVFRALQSFGVFTSLKLETMEDVHSIAISSDTVTFLTAPKFGCWFGG